MFGILRCLDLGVDAGYQASHPMGIVPVIINIEIRIVVISPIPVAKATDPGVPPTVGIGSALIHLDLLIDPGGSTVAEWLVAAPSRSQVSRALLMRNTAYVPARSGTSRLSFDLPPRARFSRITWGGFPGSYPLIVD
jgi:hypothetical protein